MLSCVRGRRSIYEKKVSVAEDVQLSIAESMIEYQRQ